MKTAAELIGSKTHSPASQTAAAEELARSVREELASLPKLDAPTVRQVEKKYVRLLQQEPGKFVYRFVRSLLGQAKWAERVVAWEVLASHPSAFQLLNDVEVDRMAEGLDDWASIDLFGVTVVGRAWREGLLSDQRIHLWARSSDRWRRRLALVATVPLNLKTRGGKGDRQRTLRVCRMLIRDRDDMVVKALSWSLRELAKRDPDAVSELIRKESEHLASRVKREVWNKLTIGRKS